MGISVNLFLLFALKTPHRCSVERLSSDGWICRSLLGSDWAWAWWCKRGEHSNFEPINPPLAKAIKSRELHSRYADACWNEQILIFASPSVALKFSALNPSTLSASWCAQWFARESSMDAWWEKFARDMWACKLEIIRTDKRISNVFCSKLSSFARFHNEPEKSSLKEKQNHFANGISRN